MTVMYYAVRHVTRFRYDHPVRETVMQLIMQPKSEAGQRLTGFQLTTRPRANLQAYTDHFGNAVYHFSVPQAHQELLIEAEATLEVAPLASAPEWVEPEVWDAFASEEFRAEHFDMLRPTRLTHPSAALDAFLAERNLTRAGDPMTALRRLGRAIYDGFSYVPSVTDVDSPIDTALQRRQGVCQDFAHVMLTVARSWGIPARYVSGYIYTRKDTGDRSDPEATHAWIEAFLPGIGWTGFDPTNNVSVNERHIRVAIGRDYSDVPPTRGVFKGVANSELSVAVTVAPAQAPKRREEFLRVVRPMGQAQRNPHLLTALDHQQQQQQQ
jgi:transglutaminase-like putative cysteine protease